MLCLEDDVEIAVLLAEEFEERGYQMCLAHEGQRGLAAILKEEPDIVLCDVSVPIMSGFEVLDRMMTLMPRFASRPFIFLNTLGDRDNQLKGLIKRNVDFHIETACRTLNVSTRIQAAVKAASGGIIEP